MRNWVRTLIIVFAAAAICASFVIVNGAKTEGFFSFIIPARKEALRPKGKRAIKLFPHGITRYDDTNQLAKVSSSILIGSVVAQKSILTSETTNGVSTHYKVLVKEVIKGDLKNNATISLRVAGARTVSANGAEVEVKLPDYWKMPQTGATYVFFLFHTDFDDYALVGGPQGMFEVSANGIKPKGLIDDPLYRANSDLDLKSFLQKIKLALAG